VPVHNQSCSSGPHDRSSIDTGRGYHLKAGLTELCSHKLIATPIANPLELHFGQEVLHGDLKCLHYDLVDMHKLTPKIQEVMEFQ
jgi:hypothetical protein